MYVRACVRANVRACVCVYASVCVCVDLCMNVTIASHCVVYSSRACTMVIASHNIQIYSHKV